MLSTPRRTSTKFRTRQAGRSRPIDGPWRGAALTSAPTFASTSGQGQSRRQTRINRTHTFDFSEVERELNRVKILLEF